MADAREGIVGAPMAFGIAHDEKNDGNGGSREEKLRLIGAIKHARVAKGLAEGVMVAACAFWVGWWLVYPEPEDRHKYVDIWIGDKISNSRFFNTDGNEGSALIFHALPFVVVTILSFVVIELRVFIKAKAEELRKLGGGGDGGGSSSSSGGWRTGWRLSTYPVWVDKSPFGIITGAEAMGILIILFVMVYHFGRVTDHSFHRIQKSNRTPSAKYWQKVGNMSFNFGRVAMLPFALLWIPVSRGSPLLRLARIPFEQAVRYHIWLAVSMMIMLTIHSVGYIITYSYTNRKHLIFRWVTRQERCAVVAGLVAWIIGLVMWVTSLSYVRRRFYDLFFRIHHLYLLFSLFWIYHVVSNYHYFVIPMLLFFVDRFIRMVQSLRLVQVSSAKVLENGVVELTMPLSSPSIQGNPLYNALSTWCIQIPGLSTLQWHFFSGASSPLDKKQALTIIIKPLGGWTNTLRDQFSDAKKGDSASCPFSFKARVEGPYGDESDFYLQYKSLVLVAGGIGITPAMAILRDILYRYKNIKQTSTSLPTSITVYHCIRKPEDLDVLDSVYPNQILPGYDTLGLSIEVHVYVTSKDMKDYPRRIGGEDMESDSKAQSFSLSEFRRVYPPSQPVLLTPQNNLKLVPPQGVISNISTTGNTKWVACITIASMLGYFLLSGIANTSIIKSYEHHTFTNYNRTHVMVACMILGIVIFGGFVLLLWILKSRQETKSLASVKPTTYSTNPSPVGAFELEAFDREAYGAGESSWVGDVHIRSRPDWGDVFDGLVEKYSGDCVGVLVSGSESLQEDIARECKRHSSLNLNASKSSNASVLFHYHSVSFSL